MSVFNRGLLLGMISCFSMAVCAAVPSDQDILKHVINLKDSYATPAKAILIGETKAVTLRSGEVAWLSAVEFENSGRNFWAGYILTRPKLQQSKILKDFGGQSNTFKVYPALNKTQPVQLVEIESAASGQGALSSSKDLVYFDGWDSKIITTVESSEYPGRYNDDSGEDDCKTGESIDGSMKLLADQNAVIKIIKTADACEGSKPVTKMEKIAIHIP